MPYNSNLTRSNLSALIPEDVSNAILDTVETESAALSAFPSIRMSAKQQRLPVLSALPTAYWVNPSDTGLKQTTQMAWANKFIEAEEIAAIVPIPEAVLDDSGFDVWAQVQPKIAEAIGRVLDEAVFFGVNKPSTFPTDIVAAAVAAGNTVNLSTGTPPTAAAGGVKSILDQVVGTVEADGYDVNGWVAPRAFRSILRQVRDTTGNRLADVSLTDIDGDPIYYAMPGQWPNPATVGSVRAIAGDFTRGFVGVRQDITYKILDQAVITDAGGLVVYNLPQQDMIALRVVFRVGFQVANPINYDQAVEANRFPFGVMRTAA